MYCAARSVFRSRRYGETGPGERSRSTHVSLITRLSPLSISTCLFIHSISLSTPSESLSCSLPLSSPPLLLLVFYLQFFTGSCSTAFCTTLPKWMQTNGTPYCSLWQTGSLKILLLPLMKLRLALCDLPCRGQYQQLKYLPLLYVILYCSFAGSPRSPS